MELWDEGRFHDRAGLRDVLCGRGDFTEQVIQGRRVIPGRSRDVQEVEHDYLTLKQVEKWVEGRQEITEKRIRKIDALLYPGRRARSTAYRDGQNVIREASGEIVYMPSEAHDVPVLMNELVAWIHRSKL